jgi:hypothetical protein
MPITNVEEAKNRSVWKENIGVFIGTPSWKYDGGFGHCRRRRQDMPTAWATFSAKWGAFSKGLKARGVRPFPASRVWQKDWQELRFARRRHQRVLASPPTVGNKQVRAAASFGPSLRRRTTIAFASGFWLLSGTQTPVSVQKPFSALVRH